MATDTAQSDGLPKTPDLATVVTPKGVEFHVAAEYAPQFQGLVTDLENSGYPLNQGTSGGFNRRFIAGTKTPSEHAFGRAIDVNSDQNPQGASQFTLPPDLAHSLAAKYGMTWGGDWSGKTRDPMHFQVASTSPSAEQPPNEVDEFLKTPAPSRTPAPTIATLAANASAPTVPHDEVDEFLKTAPPTAAPSVAPAAPTPSAAATTTAPATAPPGAQPASGVVLPPPAAATPPAPPAGVPTGSWVPPVVTNAAAGVERGLNAVMSTADAADAWLGRNVPGVNALEAGLSKVTGGAVVPGAKASAADLAHAQDLDAKYGGGTAYWLGKLGGELVGTAPLAGPLGSLVGRGAGWVGARLGDIFGSAAGTGAASSGPAAATALGSRLGTAVGTGAGSGAGFNVGVGGSQEDPNSNPLVNAATGGMGGAVAGGLGGVLGAGAGKLFGGVGSAVENMADRLGIPLSRGEKTGGLALSLEDASSGLPFSGAAKLAQQKNAAFAKNVANEMGIPGPVQNITTPMLNDAETRSGQLIEKSAAGVNIPYDMPFMTRIGQIESDAARLGADTPGHNVAKSLNDDLLSIASQNNGQIPGPEFQDFIRKGSTFDKMLKSKDPAVSDVAKEFQSALYDQAANSGTGSAQSLVDMQLGRQQWKAIQTVRPVIDRTAAGSEEMSPQRLATQIMKQYDMKYTGPGNEMQDMARVINSTKPLPSSGTAERLQRQRLWTAGLGGGAAAGGGAALYAYDPNAAADATNALAAAAAVATAGRFSRLGMPGSAYVPRMLGGNIGTALQNNLVPQQHNPLVPPPRP